MIKNIIFDLGNVLISFRPDLFIAKFTEDIARINSFMSNIIHTNTWSQLDRGTISLQQARKKFLADHPEEQPLIELFFNRWKELLTLIPKNVKLVKKLKLRGYKLYVLSNYIKEAYDYVKNKYDFFSLFDGIVISSDVKLAKPEFEIYQYLLQKYNLRPEESIFIDDTAECISQANKLNIKTIHYLAHTNLQVEFKKLGIKI
jgi:putative hydrolase of the HAD superfamily